MMMMLHGAELSSITLPDCSSKRSPSVLVQKHVQLHIMYAAYDDMKSGERAGTEAAASMQVPKAALPTQIKSVEIPTNLMTKKGFAMTARREKPALRRGVTHPHPLWHCGRTAYNI